MRKLLFSLVLGIGLYGTIPDAQAQTLSLAAGGIGFSGGGSGLVQGVSQLFAPGTTLGGATGSAVMTIQGTLASGAVVDRVMTVGMEGTSVVAGLGRLCLANVAVCAGAAILTTALGYYGYQAVTNSNGTVTVQQPGTNIAPGGTCLSNTVSCTDASGGVHSCNAYYPCATTLMGNYQYVYTTSVPDGWPSPSNTPPVTFPDGNSVSFMYTSNSWYVTAPGGVASNSTSYIYRIYVNLTTNTSAAADLSTPSAALPDSAVSQAEWGAATGAVPGIDVSAGQVSGAPFQVAAGQYPTALWQPVTWSTTQQSGDIVVTPAPSAGSGSGAVSPPTFQDPSAGANCSQSSLYTRKNCNSILEEVQAQYQQLQSTPLVQFVSGMVPPSSGGWQASWTFDFTGLGFGTQTIAIDPSYITLAQTLVMISAGLSCLRIIFAR